MISEIRTIAEALEREYPETANRLGDNWNDGLGTRLIIAFREAEIDDRVARLRCLEMIFGQTFQTSKELTIAQCRALLGYAQDFKELFAHVGQ